MDNLAPRSRYGADQSTENETAVRGPPQFHVLQNYLRTHRPPMLVVWGNNDPFFTLAGAEAIARDNPKATVMLVDGGHLALEEYSNEITAEIRALADRVATGIYRA